MPRKRDRDVRNVSPEHPAEKSDLGSEAWVGWVESALGEEPVLERRGVIPPPTTWRSASGASSGRGASCRSTSRSCTNCGEQSRRTARRSLGCLRWTTATGFGLEVDVWPHPATGGANGGACAARGYRDYSRLRSCRFHTDKFREHVESKPWSRRIIGTPSEMVQSTKAAAFPCRSLATSPLFPKPP